MSARRERTALRARPAFRRSRAARLACVLVGAALLAACGSSTHPSTGTIAGSVRHFHATVRQGAVVGGPQLWRAKRGEEVSIDVTSDTADSLHLHGYDIKRPVQAHSTSSLSFGATIPGSFVVELENNGGTELATLEVR